MHFHRAARSIISATNNSKQSILRVLGGTFALAAVASAAEWKNLLDADLSQWDTYLSFKHRTDYNGKEPTDADGKKIEPIGYGKNTNNVFSVAEEDGKLVLHVTGEIYGCVFTKEDFENYRLKLKVKWGTKKWDPRKEKLKDSGILYHSTGPAGAEYWRSWMLSQEFQIMEGHMGDFWSQANSAIDIRAFIPEGAMNSVASDRQPFRSFGAKPSISGFCLRSADHESKSGEWTELELVCFEGKSLHIVNGQVVMILQNSRFVTDGQSTPLTKGKIQLQSEAAEVMFTEIAIQEIDALPAEFARMFD
jgi:hypothetical protein